MIRSYHRPLAEYPTEARVLSTHRRAINLGLADGRIISLVTEEVGNGPATAVVTTLPPWQAGDRVILKPLDLATPWEPPPPPDVVAPELALPGLTCAAREAGPSLLPLVMALLGEPVSLPQGWQVAAIGGVTHLAAGRYASGVRGLVGLGPGLTPSGDDLLAGYVTMLHRARSPKAHEVATALTDLSLNATTPFSRHLLGWAARGVAGEHHIDWADSVLAGRSLPPDRVLAHGATSGADWVAGAVLALHHLNHEGERE